MRSPQPPKASRTQSSAPTESPATLAPTSTELRLGSRTLKFSNLQKTLYPETGFTKGDVIGYYLAIADAILPHLKGRPLTQKRYPNGVDKFFFFEKSCPAHRPDWVKTATVPSQREGGELTYCVVSDKATLAWVANLASLELHTQLYKQNNIDRPTMMVFDLDPGPPATILDCIRVGQRLRDMLSAHGLQAFPKTSGGKGLHIYVPLNTPATFAQTKQFAQAAARVLEKDDPAHVLSGMSRPARENKVFVDWSQNDQHKTTVCVYSLRARPQPTVSTPVTWDELAAALKKKRPESMQFQAPAVLQRVAHLGDLFSPVLTLKQKLPKW